MERRIALITGLFALVIGVLLVGISVFKIKTGIVAKATVIRVEIIDDGEKTLSQPVSRFINYQNKPMLFRPDAWSAEDSEIGRTMKICYTKDQNDKAFILSYWNNFGVPVHFFCIAIISLLIAGGDFLAERFFKTLNSPAPLT